jgi:hypothetical protein
MFNFSFNMYGAGTMILLFLISFIFNWVIKVNYKNKYRNWNIDFKTSSIKIGKNYLEINKKNAHFKISSSNFWKNNFENKTIILEKQDFYGNSLYSLQDIIFKAVILVNQNKWIVKNQIFFKIILFLFMNLLIISSIMNFLFGVIISVIIFVFLCLIEHITMFKYLKKINNQTIWLLQKQAINKKDAIKSFKLNKYYWIDKYISIFSESWISGFVLFKKWGNDNE